jgi:hypothetical protein
VGHWVNVSASVQAPGLATPRITLLGRRATRRDGCSRRVRGGIRHRCRVCRRVSVETGLQARLIPPDALRPALKKHCGCMASSVGVVNWTMQPSALFTTVLAVRTPSPGRCQRCRLRQSAQCFRNVAQRGVCCCNLHIFKDFSNVPHQNWTDCLTCSSPGAHHLSSMHLRPTESSPALMFSRENGLQVVQYGI